MNRTQTKNKKMEKRKNNNVIILTEIYRVYKFENRKITFKELENISTLTKNEICQSLKYCSEEGLIETIHLKCAGGYIIRGITSKGINFFEDNNCNKPKKEITINNNFNIESFIKAEAKLF